CAQCWMLRAASTHSRVQRAVRAPREMNKAHAGLQRAEKRRGHRTRMARTHQIGLEKRIWSFKIHFGFKPILQAIRLKESAQRKLHRVQSKAHAGLALMPG